MREHPVPIARGRSATVHQHVQIAHLATGLMEFMGAKLSRASGRGGNRGLLESAGRRGISPGTFVAVMPSIRPAIRRIFGSLDTYNYRLVFPGGLISHTGSWMQKGGEVGVVVTWRHGGGGVGATFAFRFLPVLLLGLGGGAIVDRYDRRTVLLITQSLAAVLAIALWLIVLTDV